MTHLPPSRRCFLTGGAALAAASILPHPACAATLPSASPGADDPEFEWEEVLFEGDDAAVAAEHAPFRAAFVAPKCAPPGQISFSALTWRSAASSAAQPEPDFAARCLSVGIGPAGRGTIDALMRAPWFAHLHSTVLGPRHPTISAAPLRDPAALCLPDAAHMPHFATIALPAAPEPAELAFARGLGQSLRRARCFVIITAQGQCPQTLALYSDACDSVVRGDGSASHHHYPIRTLCEPPSGRLICYDLYDLCSLWAGRVGDYAVLAPAADALHVEITGAATTLLEADARATVMANQLDNLSALRLLSVMNGTGQTEVTPISFRSMSRNRY
jgi:hypothetical protein